jgi:tRNA(Ile)-lysidine synthase
MPLTPQNVSIQLAKLGCAPTDRLAVAVSGGADSLALVLSAHAARPGFVHALSVDHGLRAHSAQEVQRVGAWLAAQGIAHSMLVWQGAKPSANIQAAARTARYALLTQWCLEQGIAFLATGHQADDIAETLLMRLARGSGLQGLAALPAKRTLAPSLTLLRPLLTFSKAQCQAYLQALGQPWLEDPSNTNPAFDRTHVRAQLAVLTKIGLSSAKLTQTAILLRESADFIEQQANDLRQKASMLADGALAIPHECFATPRVVLRIALTHWLQQVGGKATVRGADIERLLDRLADLRFRKATLAGCLLLRQKNTIIIKPETQRKPKVVP